MIRNLSIPLCALLLGVCIDVQAGTTENKQLVLDFTHLAFAKKQLRQAFERYVAPDYIQHNPNAPDGAEAATQFLEGFQKQFPNSSYDIQRVASEGNLVFLHVHARTSPEDRGVAVVDIFRVESGRIIEHWDVIQPVPEQSVSKHPMF
ncbi:SnoaL-like domain-containing protein [Pseudomonas capeferrum]|uniref:nuclear transport factor 2 family protein n=1 Tax=Pseudomonas capeferrum TaxID=1495066 RepID=UPI0015E2B7EB|nr:nuclear transport factor 2 family protein [Pseudomonas capeferrum]MBA1200398.1 SnoaL-like domain-containing protein [Pseudomonas capeferrum]